jgi:hypothetical protein
MAKVKKMAFGGMGSRPPVNRMPMGSSLGAKLKQTTQPTGAVGTMPAMNQMDMRQAAMQPMGALGGNLFQGATGNSNDPTRLYTPQSYQMQPNQAAVNNAPDSNLQKAFQAFNQQKNMGAPTTTGSQAAAPGLKGLGGVGAGMMKKGGAVKSKSYAKGGTVSSASKRGDGIAQRGKTKGRMV